MRSPKPASRPTPPSSSPRPIRHRLVLRLAVFLAFLALSVAGTAAWAYWTSLGTGAGFAVTGTLSPPTNVVAASSPGSSSVTVSWSSPTTGTTPDGYYVRRTRSSDGAAAFACGTSTTTLAQSPCTDASVPDGTYTYNVVAVAGSWTASSTVSAPVTVTNVVATTTTLTSSANPSVTGQTVTYTATVAPGSGSTTPSGTVAFKDAGVPITCTGGTQTLNTSGVATCQLAYPATGSHTVTAIYAGAAGFAGSTSAPLAQTVNKAATVTTLTSSANPAVTKQVVTYTATVTATLPGSGTPTGAVAFKDGNSALSCTGGTQTLNGSGVATCQVTWGNGSVGTHSITAEYAADTNYAKSTSTALSQQVAKASTTTNLSTSGSPAKTGTVLTYTATVAAVSPGAGAPTGTVSFQDGANSVACSGGNQTLNGSAVATCQVSYASAGVHQVTAVYAGDADYSTSTSTALQQRVVNAAVVGLGFANVQVTPQNGSPTTVTPTCTAFGPNYSCTVPGSNSASLSTLVRFINISGTATVYAADSTSVSTSWTGRAPGSGPITITGGASTSTGTVSTQKSAGNNNPATITLTFTDGLNSFTATLTIT